MKRNIAIVVCAAALVSVITGCSSSPKKPVYDASQTGTIIREQRGEIVAVRDVVIKPTDLSGSIGGGPGARIGSAAGAGIMGGSLEAAKVAIGRAVGRDLGSKLDEKAGEEITIRLDERDETIIVVQEREEIPLAPGQRVKVQIGRPNPILRTGGVRVVPDEMFAGPAVASATR